MPRKKLIGRTPLWVGSAVALDASSGTTRRWSTTNGFTTDVYSAATWMEIDVSDCDELTLEWSGTISNVGTQTFVKQSNLRAACVGILNEANDPHPIVAAGTLGAGVAQDYGLGLGVCGRAATNAASPSTYGFGLMTSDLGFSGTIHSQCFMKSEAVTGVTPVDGDASTWTLRIGDAQNLIATTVASASTPAQMNWDLGQYSKIWIALQHHSSQTDGATETLSITGSLIAMKYRYFWPTHV